MRRAVLIGLAVACLAISVLLVPAAPGGQGSLTTAIGRSLGGLRVLVVDILFVRAGALVAAGSPGDLAEAQSLYETVLELDPDNDAAHAFLVDMYAIQVLPFATTREDRFRWWREGWELAHRGLDLNPRSAHLHNRIAELLIDVSVSPVEYVKELRPFVDEFVPDRQSQIIDHLLAAARITENLPNRGRMHLVHLSDMLPEIAIDAGRRGDKALLGRALTAAKEVQVLRGEVLSEMFSRVIRPDGTEGTSINRGAMLEAGMNVAARIRAALAEGRRDDALRAIEAYAEVVGQNRVLAAFMDWVGG